MSNTVTSRLAKDSSILDNNLILRAAVSPELRTSDKPDSKIYISVDTPAPEVLASKGATNQVSARLVPEQLEIGNKDEDNKQPGNKSVHDGHHEDENEVRATSRDKSTKETEETCTEPHLESFASALDYVLKHLAEDAEEMDAERYISYM